MIAARATPPAPPAAGAHRNPGVVEGTGADDRFPTGADAYVWPVASAPGGEW